MINACRRAALALWILVASPCGMAVAVAADAAPPVPASTLQPVPAPVSIVLESPVASAPTASDAPAITATSGIPWELWLVFGLAALAGIETAIRGLRALFGVIAPRTTNTVDDSIRDALGKVDDVMIDVLHTLRRLAPVATSPVAAAVAVGDPPVAKVPIPMPIPGPGRWRSPGIVLIALLLGGMATQVSCATVKATAVAAGRAIIECAKEDVRAEIAGITAQLGAEAATSAIDRGAIGWPELEAAAWSNGKIVGGCALAEFVGAWSTKHPDVQGLVAATDPGREALARLSARWGGVEWRTGTAR